MPSEPQETTGTAPTRRKGLLRAFAKRRDGATVIEFALLAFPFTVLVFAILESCISFGAEVYLQNVTDDVARQLRTAQLPRADLTEDGAPKMEKLRERICDRLEAAFVSAGCPGLKIDLRNYPTFAEMAKLKTIITPEGDVSVNEGGFKFEPGLSQSKNILRVYYEWPVITDIMRGRMSNLWDNKTLHFATATWQNEPFPD